LDGFEASCEAEPAWPFDEDEEELEEAEEDEEDEDEPWPLPEPCEAPLWSLPEDLCP
jgi:hypothetical protein